jgi:hypothetical protein
MVLTRLKEPTKRCHGQAPTIGFRVSYYAFCVLIAVALVGVLYLGSLLK